MKNSIVTKTGDSGKTYLFGEGIRVKKSHIRVKAYGEIDELNSIIGIIVASSSLEELNEILEIIQNHLFEFGSDIAIPSKLYEKSFTQQKKDRFNEYLGVIEDKINDLEPNLPPLRNFILPGGSQESSYLHLARTVCRRVERSITELMESEIVDRSVLIYFNRLSDLFFILARYSNVKNGIEDRIWKSESYKT